MQLENRSICAKCGGKCCKRCGCEISAQDFPRIDIDYLQSKIDEGFVSITCDVAIAPDNSKLIILFMRMRNVCSPAIDLVSFGFNQCAALTPGGCMYDFAHRPSGGKTLMPQEGGHCRYVVPADTFVLSWQPYQGILRVLIVRNTGLTPEQRLSQEVEDGFYKCIDAFQKGNAEEAVSFIRRISIDAFNEEFTKAKNRYIKALGQPRMRTFFKNI